MNGTSRSSQIIASTARRNAPFSLGASCTGSETFNETAAAMRQRPFTYFPGNRQREGHFAVVLQAHYRDRERALVRPSAVLEDINRLPSSEKELAVLDGDCLARSSDRRAEVRRH